ncbi:MAG: DUF481 domain-containing protein [Deltaproteobacteria bacterium]|nr:DUF481 domain-containing protein [Deltaproteobacteria bacterium]
MNRDELKTGIVRLIVILLLVLAACPAAAEELELGRRVRLGPHDTAFHVLRLTGHHGPLSYELARMHSESDGLVTQDTYLGTLNYNLELNRLWSLWLDERYSESLTARDNLAGAGLKRYLVRGESMRLSVSLGLLRQWEQRVGKEASTFTVWSLRPKFGFERGALTVDAVYFHIQATDNPGEITRRGRVSVKYKVSEGWSFGVAIEAEKRPGLVREYEEYWTVGVNW